MTGRPHHLRLTAAAATLAVATVLLLPACATGTAPDSLATITASPRVIRAPECRDRTLIAGCTSVSASWDIEGGRDPVGPKIITALPGGRFRLTMTTLLAQTSSPLTSQEGLWDSLEFNGWTPTEPITPERIQYAHPQGGYPPVVATITFRPVPRTEYTFDVYMDVVIETTEAPRP